MMESLEIDSQDLLDGNDARGFVRPIAYPSAECRGVGAFALCVVLALMLLLAAASLRAQPFGKAKNVTVKPNVASESLDA